MTEASGAERSTAIVLFTDLVGSTELRSRLGDEGAEEIRRTHDRLVAKAIEVNRGRLVKNLGDGVMAMFAGASNAVTAAVRIQQALERYNRSPAGVGPLEVRIGLSAGDVAIEGEDCFGVPVIEAARLCAAARGGQVLVSEVVRWLAGSTGGHRFTSVGVLELRGLAAAVPTCEVAWEPLPEPPIPMPVILTRAGRIFVGRNEELEHLLRLWKQAVAGEWRLALLAGEPGIGKTRLAIELARAVHEAGGIVLAGRCDEDLGVPYQPFVEALRHYVTYASQGRLGRHPGELARLCPELSQLLAGLPEPLRSDPETERYRLFDAVACWLSDVCGEAPVLFVLDDLHWAAKPTLLLLRHVLRCAEPLRLLVVVTYRDSDIGRGHPMSEFLAELRRDGGVERRVLSGLDTPAVAAFIEAAAGHRLTNGEQELPRVVRRETEGNPFFVAEVLRHLAESRALEQREGRWVLTASIEELGIPEGVRDVVGRRLSRLSESTNRVLSVAAVVGLEFEPAVVERAAEVQQEEFFAALEAATAARLLSEMPDERYRFAHALVRSTLYQELSGPRRVALHRRVATAIEELHSSALDDHLPALAHHWARAAAPAADTVRAVDYTTRAGNRALAQLAHDEAVAYYRQALELLDAVEGCPDEERRLQLLICLGEAQRRAGDSTYREILLRAARLAQECGDSQALARAALANSRGLLPSSVTRVDRDRVAILEAALSASVVADTSERALLLARLGLELTASVHERERRLSLSDEALAMARRIGDNSTLTQVLTARFYTLLSPGTLATRLTDTTELVEVAGRLGDPMTVALAHFMRARVRTEHGEVQNARADLEVTERIAAELGQPTLRWYSAWARAAHLLLCGRLTEAEIVAVEAGRLAEATGQPDRSLFLAVQLFGVRFEQDRLNEMEHIWVNEVQRYPEATSPQTFLALTLVELGRTVEAQTLLQDLATDNFALIPINIMWLAEVTVLSVVAARVGDLTCSTMLEELLAPYANHMAGFVPLWLGSVSYYLGVLNTTLGRYHEAETHFAAAETTHKRIDASTWLARTYLEWARMLRARRALSDKQRASDLLHQALTIARQFSLINVERHTVALLTSFT